MILRKRDDERFFNRSDITKFLEISLIKEKCYLLGDLIESIKTGKGITKEDRGFGEINYLKVGNIGNYFLKFDEVEVISDEILKRYEMDILEENDLTISRVGTVGNVSIFRKNDSKSTFSDNVIRIRLKKSKMINPFYVCIFLNSINGKAQIRRYSKQSLQEVINQTSLRRLIVPLPEINIQNNIANQVQEYFDKIEEFRELINQEFENIGKTIPNLLFTKINPNFEKLNHSDLMERIDELNSVAVKNSIDFEKQAKLDRFK